MPLIKFAGQTRETFTWNSMGKTVSYSLSPGEVKNIPADHIPYLLSFGNFEAIAEAAPVTSPTITPDPFERNRVDPIIVTTNPEPIIPEIKVVEDAPITQQKNTKHIDYISLKKAELKKICKQRGLDDSGNKDDLIATIVNNDNKS